MMVNQNRQGAASNAELDRAIKNLNSNLDRQLSQGQIIKNFYPDFAEQLKSNYNSNQKVNKTFKNQHKFKE